MQSPGTDLYPGKQLSLKVMDREAWQRSKSRAWMGTLGAVEMIKKNEWTS